MDEVACALKILSTGFKTFSFQFQEEILVYTVEVLASLTRFTYDEEAG